jgi:hypothetical protein
MAKMRGGDYIIYSVGSNGEMHVVADMLAHGMEWPTVIHDPKTGKDFSFRCNEVMEDWMVGRYSGHAKYIEIPQETTQSK